MQTGQDGAWGAWPGKEFSGIAEQIPRQPRGGTTQATLCFQASVPLPLGAAFRYLVYPVQVHLLPHGDVT